MNADGAYVLLILIGVLSLFAYYLSSLAVDSGDEHDVALGYRIRALIFPIAGLLSTAIIVCTLY
jgi:hypothetical protein